MRRRCHVIVRVRQGQIGRLRLRVEVLRDLLKTSPLALAALPCWKSEAQSTQSGATPLLGFQVEKIRAPSLMCENVSSEIGLNFSPAAAQSLAIHRCRELERLSR